MFRLVLLEQSRLDLADFQRYITRTSGNRVTARRQLGKLTARLQKLACYDFQLGRSRPDLGPDVRSLTEGRYVLFLRYRGETLEIIRIIEGHRDLPTAFEARDIARPVFEVAI